MTTKQLCFFLDMIVQLMELAAEDFLKLNKNEARFVKNGLRLIRVILMLVSNLPDSH
jgi:hypothetical protein